MSASRAKKKQRRRTRAAGGAAATRESSSTFDDDAKVAQKAPAPRPAPRPARFEVRDGVRRPDAIWSPFPLTEIGMATGLIIALLGFASESSWLLSIGVIVLFVVVFELSLREHFAGFRSHTLLLAVLPVMVGHALVYFVVSDAWVGPFALAVDVALTAALAWLLQARFRTAHERARGTP